MLAFYTLSLVVVFLGIIINLPGSLHINPLLLHFYEPHKVLFLTTVFLTLGALGRIIVFWKHILWKEAALLSIYGVCGGLAGGFLVGYLSQKIIIIIFFASGGYCLFKYLSKKDGHVSRTNDSYGLLLSGFLASFLQSFGLSVGVLRQGYLFSRGYDLVTVQGTIGFVFLTSGLAMIVSRSINEAIPLKETIFILLLFPFMLITMFIAKKVIYKIPKKIQEYIIIYSLVVSLLLAVPYLFA